MAVVAPMSVFCEVSSDIIIIVMAICEFHVSLIPHTGSQTQVQYRGIQDVDFRIRKLKIGQKANVDRPTIPNGHVP